MQSPYQSPVSGAASAPGAAYFLIFPLEDRRYAVAMENVERVVRAFAPAPLPKGPAAVSGLLNMHGRVLPLLNLRHIFGLPERALAAGDYFIIAAGPAGACAIPADSAPELAACLPEDIVAAEAEIRGKYARHAIKGRGALVLVFDTRELPLREGPPEGER